MTGPTATILGFGGGVLLGAGFYAGLWWTVKRLAQSARPGTLMAVSLLVRMAIALAGFYLAARGGGGPLIACLLGFLLARLLVARASRPRSSLVSPANLLP